VTNQRLLVDSITCSLNDGLGNVVEINCILRHHVMTAKILIQFHDLQLPKHPNDLAIGDADSKAVVR
jgi:hypothetical protein